MLLMGEKLGVKKEAEEAKPVLKLAWEDVLGAVECGGGETLEQLPCTVAIHVGDLGEKLWKSIV